MLTILGVNSVKGFGFESPESHHLMSAFVGRPLMSLTSFDYPKQTSNESVEEWLSFLAQNKSTYVIIERKTSFEVKLTPSLAKPVSQLSNDWSLISQQIIMLLVVKILLL